MRERGKITNFLFFLEIYFFAKLKIYATANVMPKPNSTTEMTANLNQQEAMLANSSNTNLNSRVVEAQTTKSKRKLHVDDECDAIGDLIGHYGKWQFMMTILLSLFQVPNTFHIFSPTFQVSNLFKAEYKSFGGKFLSEENFFPLT